MARPSSNRNRNRERPPLDAAALDRLALHYLGRYATTRAKLADYLRRKVDERGWAGSGDPPVDDIVRRVADLGYVDDRAFANMRSAALARRGYGERRQADALRAAGVTDADRVAVFAAQDEDGEDRDYAAALAFARRKRLGAFASAPLDQDGRRKALAAMIRAGHGFEIARRFIDAAPGEMPEP